MRVTESIEINRDLAQVWDFISDPMNDPVWCPKVTLVNQVAPGRWVVQHKPIPLRPPAALTVDQIAIAAPHRLVLHEEDGASIFEVEYQLEPTSAGMRFTQVSDFTWKRLPVIVQRLLAPGVRRDVRRQLRELKRTLEAS